MRIHGVLRVLVVFMLGLGMAFCTRQVPSPQPSVTPRATEAQAGSPVPSPTSVVPPSPTPSPLPPTPTTVPRPPLHPQRLLPEDWLDEFWLGGPDTQGALYTIGRGAVIVADVHPTQGWLALGHATGLYLCDPPQDPAGDTLLRCRHFFPHDGWVTAVAFSPDGSRMVTLDAQAHMYLWDLSTDPPERTRIPNAPRAYDGFAHLAFSPHGRFLAVASYDVAIWDVENRSWKELPAPPEGALRGLGFSDDARTLYTYTLGGYLYAAAWQQVSPSTRDEEVWKTLFVDEKYRAKDLMYASEPDGPTLFLLSSPKDSFNVALHRWRLDAQSMETIRPPDLESYVMLAGGSEFNQAQRHLLARGPGGMLAVASAVDPVYIYDATSLALQRSLVPPEQALSTEPVLVDFLPGSTQVVAVWQGGSVAVWDATTGELTGWAPSFAYLAVEGLGVDPYGRGIAALFYHHPARFDLRLMRLGMLNRTGARNMYVPSTGCHLVFYNFTDFPFDPLVTLCKFAEEPASLMELPEIAYDIPPVSLPPTDWLVLITDAERRLEIWDLFTVQRLHQLSTESVGRPASLAASPDGRVFVGGTGGRIGVWDPIAGALLDVWRLPGASSSSGEMDVSALAVSSDGRRMAVLYGERVALWDLDTGEVVMDASFEDLGAYGYAPEWAHLSPQARFLFFESGPEIMAVDLERRQVVTRWLRAGFEGPIAFDPTERLLMYGGAEGCVVVQDIAVRLAPSVGTENLLPLVVMPESAPSVPSFRSEYTITLTVDGRTYTLLDLRTAGQKPPYALFLQIRGQGWPVQGEMRLQGDQALPRYRATGQDRWQAALDGDVPPTAPLLRAWPWQYQGVQEGRSLFTSTAPTAAVPPPSALIRRALEVPQAVFLPETFQGQVALNPEGVLVEARLTWQGEVRLADAASPAEIQVRYRAYDFGRAVLPEEDEEQVPLQDPSTGIPLPPNTAETGEPGVYQVNMGRDEVLEWYRQVLNEQGYLIHNETTTVLAGVETLVLEVGKAGRLYRIYLAGSGSVTLVLIEGG